MATQFTETILLELIAESKSAEEALERTTKKLTRYVGDVMRAETVTKELGKTITATTKRWNEEAKELDDVVTVTEQLTKKQRTLIKDTTKLGQVVLQTTNRYGELIQTFDDGKGTLTKVNTTTKELISSTKELKTGFLGLGQTLGYTASKVALWTISTGIIYGTVSAVKQLFAESLKLERMMARVATVTRFQSGPFKDLQTTIQAMRKEVLDFAVGRTASIEEVAESLYYLGSAGLDVAEQLAGMQHIANLTIGTWGDMAEIGKTVAGIVNNFGDSLTFARTEEEKFQYVSDLIAKTFSEQQVEISEIAGAFQYAGSAAGLMDISLQALMGTIGFLNTAMLKGSKAGRTLLRAFVDIGRKSEQLEYSFGVIIDPSKPLDFMDIMTQLHDNIGDVIEQQTVQNLLWKTFGTVGGKSIMLILQKWDQFRASIDALDPDDIEGYAEKLKELASDQIIGQWKQLGNAIVGAADSIGLLGAATYLTKGFVEGGVSFFGNIRAYIEDVKEFGISAADEMRRLVTTLEELEKLRKPMRERQTIGLPLIGEITEYDLQILNNYRDSLKSLAKERGEGVSVAETYMEPGIQKAIDDLLAKEEKRYGLAIKRIEGTKIYIAALREVAVSTDDVVEKQKILNKANELELSLKIRTIEQGQRLAEQEAQRREQSIESLFNAQEKVDLYQRMIDGESQINILLEKQANLETYLNETRALGLEDISTEIELQNLILKILGLQNRELTKATRLYSNIGRELGRGISDSMVLAVTDSATKIQKLQVWNRMGQNIGDTVGREMSRRIQDHMKEAQLGSAFTRALTGDVTGGLIAGAIGIISQLLFPVKDPIEEEVDALIENTRSIRELTDTFQDFQERLINAPAAFSIGATKGEIPQFADMGLVTRTGIAMVDEGEVIGEPQQLIQQLLPAVQNSFQMGDIIINASEGMDENALADKVVRKISGRYDRGGEIRGEF